MDTVARAKELQTKGISRCMGWPYHAMFLNEIAKGLTNYGQPVTTLHFSNGKKLSFTINFGDQDRDHYCAYFYYL